MFLLSKVVKAENAGLEGINGGEAALPLGVLSQAGIKDGIGDSVSDLVLQWLQKKSSAIRISKVTTMRGHEPSEESPFEVQKFNCNSK